MVKHYKGTKSVTNTGWTLIKNIKYYPSRHLPAQS